jgi:3-deoxy-manno-octulosonate cytidylyltransferase (CMP-KDO synthetase)
VLVATDDERIQEAVRGFGGEVVMTGRHHVSGTDRIAEVAEKLDESIVVNVQGDIPFLDPEMLAAGVRPLLDDEALPMATIKTPVRDREELENPNVVKVVTDRSGYALYFSRYPIPYRRDAGEAGCGTFRHIGLYAYRRDFLLRFARLAPTPLECEEKLEQLRALEWGFRIKVAEVAEASIEVDTAADLERARALAVRAGALPGTSA